MATCTTNIDLGVSDKGSRYLAAFILSEEGINRLTLRDRGINVAAY